MSSILKKTSTKVALVFVALALLVGVTWAVVANLPSNKVTVITDAKKQLTEISYHGKDGQTALALLKNHATVETKKYSFGEMVTSVNGSTGNGSKYWMYYVNDKEATVGAGTYETKSTDTITWRLK